MKKLMIFLGSFLLIILSIQQIIAAPTDVPPQSNVSPNFSGLQVNGNIRIGGQGGMIKPTDNLNQIEISSAALKISGNTTLEGYLRSKGNITGETGISVNGPINLGSDTETTNIKGKQIQMDYANNIAINGGGINTSGALSLRNNEATLSSGDLVTISGSEYGTVDVEGQTIRLKGNTINSGNFVVTGNLSVLGGSAGNYYYQDSNWNLLQIPAGGIKDISVSCQQASHKVIGCTGYMETPTIGLSYLGGAPSGNGCMLRFGNESTQTRSVWTRGYAFCFDASYMPPQPPPKTRPPAPFEFASPTPTPTTTQQNNQYQENINPVNIPPPNLFQ